MHTLFLTASIVKFSEIPPMFWVASLSGILCAVVLGFFCGYYYSNTEDSRALEKAGKQIQKLVDLASLRLTQANQVCTELEKVTSGTLPEKDRDLLGRLQASISEKLTGFLQKHETTKKSVSEPPPEEMEPIEWEFETIDPVTLLPCADSMDNNLTQMIERSQKSMRTCGALLCKIDKYDNLKSRVGENTIEHFRKKFSSLLIRSVTEMDLVCQMDESTFLILLPKDIASNPLNCLNRSSARYVGIISDPLKTIMNFS